MIAKQPLAMFHPPPETREEVAVVKFAEPPIENLLPGVEVPTPTLPFVSMVSAGVDEVAKVDGEDVER